MKPVFRVSDQVQHKPGCTITEDGKRLEISDLASRGIVLSAPLFSHTGMLKAGFSTTQPFSLLLLSQVWMLT